MTTSRTAGALAATCSIFLLGACGSGGSGTTAAPSTSTSVSASPAAPATSTGTSSASTPSGTSTPSAGSSTAAAAPAAAAKITIKNFKYQVPTSVKPGATITVTNSDAVDHTVTSDTKGLFDAVIPGSGGTHTITAPTKPGRYPFHCTYHANMHGVLVVS